MIHTELVAAIGAWLNRPDVEPSIPTFITLAEAAINRRLAQAGAPGAMQRATATVNSEYAAAPADMARPVAARLSTGETLEIITLESLELLKSAAPGTRGPPRYLAVAGGETPLRLWPAPDGAVSLELSYQARLEPVGVGNATNWVLATHPDVYLYGALLQSAPFLGQDGRIAAWASLHAAALDAMMAAQDDGRGATATPAFRAHMPHRCAS